jgi:hypothetical protein
MRGSLRLELNTTNLSLPSVECNIGLLFNQFLGEQDNFQIKMRCVNIQEALVEKLVSFPRRVE